MLRINLLIRRDVAPHLYAVLAPMPPKPRAEFLRKIAELGLRLQQEGRLPPPSIEVQAALGDRGSDALTQKRPHADSEAFGDQLMSVVGDSF